MRTTMIHINRRQFSGMENSPMETVVIDAGPEVSVRGDQTHLHLRGEKINHRMALADLGWYVVMPMGEDD